MDKQPKINKECAIVRDLMPLRIDDICSEEAKEMVDTHVKTCAECAQIYGYMCAKEPAKANPKEKATFSAAMRQMRKTVAWKRFKYIFFGILIALVLAYAGMYIRWQYFGVTNTPLPTDAYSITLTKSPQGILTANLTFTDKVYNGILSEDETDGIAYLTYETTKVKSEMKNAERSGYSQTLFTLFANEGVVCSSSPVYPITEVRVGTPDDYTVIYRTGDLLAETENSRNYLPGEDQFAPITLYQTVLPTQTLSPDWNK